MRTFLVLALTAILFTACSSVQEPATKLERANVLPLALDNAFQFRKIKMYYNQPVDQNISAENEPATFERNRINFGAVDSWDRQQREGNYYCFFWRATQEADVTVRFEYRQAALGNYVMAQERYYPSTRGSHKSDFEVTGDDFQENGRVTSWRVLLIVDGRIVAFRQSFMWK
ncbi:hypothetical protein TSACC_3337 [Terrimicrobium sacchariphilum]|uniref:Lipoprotein n=1 Tax=Terrimicrobium sacchariphilum TaxID=690879 RepID=A0A146GDP4_TERSA|nr:hypothetical protein [Terrimicrobium sacchariphilum]GAT35272.1 hypothetical protein TSACC_3337 [Terrimicrobium sacchariphilum]